MKQSKGIRGMHAKREERRGYFTICHALHLPHLVSGFSIVRTMDPHLSPMTRKINHRPIPSILYILDALEKIV